MITRLFFGNWTSIVPLAIGFVICICSIWLLHHVWPIGSARGVGWAIKKRIACLHRLRSLVPILPLSGLFGTIYSLIMTLDFMAKADNVSEALPDVIARFAPALSSTLWGIIGAVTAIVIIELGLHQLEETDKEEDDG